ncbi:sensor histidine kinase [Nocardia vaccinii]|uniref:sensor histidine kinase n=1 Tax=Nocardia vaccinii TaxID=1822 RepID=UPI0009FC3A58|nr:sensor histidine kinase [Nocardia vaccinii]
MPVRTWSVAAVRLVSGLLDRLAGLGASDTTSVRRGWFGAVMATVWLFGLFAPITQRWNEGQYLLAGAAGACVIVFGAIVALSFTLFPQPGWDGGLPSRTVDRRAWPVLGVLGVLSAVTLILLGGPGLATLTYLATMSIFLLPSRESARFAFSYAILMLVVPMLVPDWRLGGVPFYLAAIPILIWGGREIGIRRRRTAELERRQRAEMAIIEDRNRVARDVHDILGHSLTVITVKTELALRLIDLDPERARAEMSDVERLAREALAGVRDTVGGLREVSLAGELANVRTALGAAGIEAELPDGDFGDYHAIFGWVLREAVTNVVRHSAASHCTVRVGPSRIEVIDDGTGLRPDAEFGSGLAGLRERVRAAGGALTLAAAPGGGLRVTADFPGMSVVRTDYGAGDGAEGDLPMSGERRWPR